MTRDTRSEHDLRCVRLGRRQHAGREGSLTTGALMAEVRLQEGESLENALRRFKRKVQTEGIIKEVKRHSFYLKPGEKRRVKQALARKQTRKKIRKESD
jgi:small subunit ribosomal protein S21